MLNKTTTVKWHRRRIGWLLWQDKTIIAQIKVSSRSIKMLSRVIILGVLTLSLALDCEVVYGSCGFYRDCIEELKYCGPTGYAIAYGDFYCNRFPEILGPLGDSKLDSWMYNVMSCLQNSLLGVVPNIENGDLSCNSLEEFAFDSHPKCYTDAGFCDLSVAEQAHVFGVVKASDVFTVKSLKQMYAVAKTCYLALENEMPDYLIELRDLLE